MPNIRKPTNVLKLNGSLKHNAGRLADRKNEPAHNGEIGNAPESLTPEELECWNYIIEISYPGVLCYADRIVVEALARTLALSRSTTEIDIKVFARIESLLGKLGMTPSDRSRVQAKKKDEQSPYQEFA